MQNKHWLTGLRPDPAATLSRRLHIDWDSASDTVIRLALGETPAFKKCTYARAHQKCVSFDHRYLEDKKELDKNSHH